MPKAKGDGNSSKLAKNPIQQDLPIVEAPKLDGSGPTVSMPVAPSEPIALAGEPAAKSEPVAATAAPTSPVLSRSSRFAILAASVAAAAAIGSLVGSISGFGLAHMWKSDQASTSTAQASTLQAMKAEMAELSALKASLDSAARGANAQFAKISERLDRVERASADPATKISHIVDTVDRIEKRSSAAAETTASIAPSPPAPPASAEAKLPDKVLQDWVVEGVRRGHALVASRYGGVFEVAEGSSLPGLGHVEMIKRHDGQWVVVTERGLITTR
jgi:hypothetical protein